MSITLLQSGNKNGGAYLIQDVNITIDPGTNRYLLLRAVAPNSAGADVTGVVLDPTGLNIALTQLKNFNAGTPGQPRCMIFGLKDAEMSTASGALVVRITFGSTCRVNLRADLFSGVDQTTPYRALPNGVAATTGSPTEISVTSDDGDYVLDAYGAYSGTSTTVASEQTEDYKAAVLTSYGGFAHAAGASPDVTMGWTQTGASKQGLVAISLIPAATSNTYDDSVSEGVVLGDTQLSTLGAINSRSDGLVIGDTESAGIRMSFSEAEGLKLGDAYENSLTQASELHTPTIALDAVTSNRVTAHETVAPYGGTEPYSRQWQRCEYDRGTLTWSEWADLTGQTTTALDDTTAQPAKNYKYQEVVTDSAETPAQVASNSIFANTLDRIDRAVTEGLKLGDSYSARFSGVRTLSEGLKLGDSIGLNQIWQQALSEGLVLGDSESWGNTFAKSFSDGILLGMDYETYLQFINPDEGSKLGDAFGAVLAHAEEHTEGLVVSDDFVATYIPSGEYATYDEEFSDGLVVGDTFEAENIIRDFIVDGLKFGDSRAFIGQMPRAVSEGTRLGDSYTTRGNWPRSRTEGVVLGSAFAAFLNGEAPVSQGLTLTDIVEATDLTDSEG